MNETILQFGAGNFLRAFVDTFVHEMNAAGQNAGRIVVVQSTEGERARLMNAQGGKFHLVVRGMENGTLVDRVQEIGSISRALVADTQWSDVLAVARSPHLRAIVSNTTEAGLTLDAADTVLPEESSAPRSFPGKLLVCLRARWQAEQSGPLILPCELVENNADRVRALVLGQAAKWNWTEPTFIHWLEGNCVWVNSLVDRIASGKPASHPLLADDALLTVTEPFQFWAVESKPGTEWMVHPAIFLAPDIQPYTLRKVRILNGAHTSLVAHVKKTRPDILLVRDALVDPEINAWLHGLLFEEIVPTIEDRAPDALAFAHQTLERFANPFLDHKLSDIALHHDKKVPVRLVPTRDEYMQKFGKVPVRLQEAIDNPL